MTQNALNYFFTGFCIYCIMQTVLKVNRYGNFRQKGLEYLINFALFHFYNSSKTIIHFLAVMFKRFILKILLIINESFRLFVRKIFIFSIDGCHDDFKVFVGSQANEKTLPFVKKSRKKVTYIHALCNKICKIFTICKGNQYRKVQSKGQLLY